MNDAGHQETNEMLESLEARIKREYRQASKEVKEKLDGYLKQFRADDKTKRKMLSDGKLSESEYKDWRRTQIMGGKRWIQMRDTLAEDYANVNKITSKITGDHLKDVYALNHNYGTYEIEHGSSMSTSYTLYDHSTVERLLRDNPKLIPDPGKATAQKTQSPIPNPQSPIPNPLFLL